MDRILKLCAYLDKCESFADVGCDHGYCTKYMLENDLCERAIISDVSAKCLAKAERLLSNYIAAGRVKSVLCSGLEKIDEGTRQILIAGMGGEEIISILKASYIPASFVLQPMKNVREVRDYLLSQGARITVDEVFSDGGKFYFVLKGKREGQGQAYTPVQLEYGLNLQSDAMKEYLLSELSKKREYLKRPLNARSRAEIEARARILEGILNGEIK